MSGLVCTEPRLLLLHMEPRLSPLLFKKQQRWQEIHKPRDFGTESLRADAVHAAKERDMARDDARTYRVTAVAAATLGAEALRVAEALSTAAGTAYGWALGVRTSRFF